MKSGFNPFDPLSGIETDGAVSGAAWAFLSIPLRSTTLKAVATARILYEISVAFAGAAMFCGRIYATRAWWPLHCAMGSFLRTGGNWFGRDNAARLAGHGSTIVRRGTRLAMAGHDGVRQGMDLKAGWITLWEREAA